MILIVSGVSMLIGIVFFVIGLVKDDSNIGFSGFFMCFLSAAVGFGLLGATVETNTCSSFPEITNIISNEHGVCYVVGNKTVYSDSVDIVKNPDNYEIAKIESLNSYGKSTGSEDKYVITKKHNEDVSISYKNNRKN